MPIYTPNNRQKRESNLAMNDTNRTPAIAASPDGLGKVRFPHDLEATTGISGILTPGSDFKVKKSFGDNTFHRVRYDGPKPVGKDSPVPIPANVERCPVCRTPFCVGFLGHGTRIEVVCRRSGCVHNNKENPFTRLVP